MEQRDYRFTNWAKTQQCRPESFLQPATDSEIVDIFQRAKRENLNVRMVGAGHSWNDIVCTNGFLVNLDRHAQSSEVRIDYQKKQATLSAGMRIVDVTRVLNSVGLALSSLGSVNAQSIAGAISTGTHGSGLRFGNIASRIVSLKLVTPTGERLLLSETQEPELFEAAKVSLGALGVITEVTIQCENRFNLREKTYTLSFDQAWERLEEIVQSHDHVKFWWLPHTDDVQVFISDRTHDTVTKPNRTLAWLESSGTLEQAFSTLLRVGKQMPRVVPYCNKIVSTVYFRPNERVERSDQVFRVPVIPIHRETEFSVPYNQGANAMRAIRAMIERERLFVNFIVELRLVAKDNAMLSPAYGRDSWHIGGYMAESPDLEKYFRMFSECLMPLGGRPHWGKEFTATKEEIFQAFPQAKRFSALRNQCDPEQVLMNPFLHRVFG